VTIDALQRALLGAFLVTTATAAPLGAAVVCGATDGRGPRADAHESTSEVDVELAALLAPERPEDQAVAGLAALGANLAPRLITFVRPTSERPEGRSLSDGDWRRIELGIDRLPRAAVARALETALVGEDDPATTRVALRLFGRVASSEQADLYTSLLRELALTSVRPGPDLDLVRTATAAVQSRDRSFSRALVSRSDALPSHWLLPLARALAVGRSADDLELLWHVATRGGKNEVPALTLLGDLAPAYVGAVSETRLSYLRSRLTAVDVGTVERAIVALTRLCDDQCAEQLVALMSQANPRIVDAAYWGLRELSGLPTGPDVARWEKWLEDSRAWWREHGDELADDLRWGNADLATERIVEIASQRLRRHELVHALTLTFERDEEEVVDLAIRCLRELRWQGTKRHLVELLEHPAARVQGRAWRALRELTGFDAGPDPEGWRLALLL
jgi:hypothetical protein